MSRSKTKYLRIAGVDDYARKGSFKTLFVKQVSSLQQQTGSQFSAVEWKTKKTTVCGVLHQHLP